MAGRTVGGGVSARALITVALSVSLAAIASLSCAHAGGGALPTNGQYVAGSGSIAKTGSTGLTINQSSNSGIINWKSFSIGNGNSVQFNNGSGATLNRVTGGDLSTIAGSLTGTGSVYLINPQGVIVTNTGKVLTGGTFVGSTRDETDDDFTNGKRHFSGTSKGNVVNRGQIVSSNGDVTLIGNAVTNNGTVSAPNGTASLNAGNDVLLAPAGSNGRIMISGGSGDASNSGTISAAQAQLNAAGGNVYALSGNNGGIVRATGTATIGGHVWLTSGTGNVSTAGTIAATNADGSGGTIESTGANITTAGTIDASATAAGQTGGNVHIVSTGTTKVGGTIAANGGAQGQGGFVETSGEQLHVADDAKITTLATDGIAGTWLIDPADFTIAATGGDITGATLSSELDGGDIVIQSSGGTVNTSGNGDIFVNDAVTWASGHTLTLDAYRNIDIGASISITGGLDLIYGDQAQTGTGNAANGDLDFGLTSSGFTGHVDYGATNNGGTLAINGISYTLLYNMSDVQAINSSNIKLDGQYALAHSLDASSVSSWTPIGTDGAGNNLNSTGFQGTFEGLGNTISNLSIDLGSTDEVGLFGYSSGMLSDVGLIGGTVNGHYAVGQLAGVQNGRTITDTYATGVVNGVIRVGGLVGLNGGTIIQSQDSGTVSGPSGDSIGGLVGENGGTVTTSYATTGVTGYDSVGGLVGLNDTHATITKSYATGTVGGGEYYLGGLVGDNNDGTITNAYAMGSVAGDFYTGGLAGGNSGSISNTYTTGAVSGDQYVGGLVGYNSTGSINSSYAAGLVHGSTAVGGLVGYNSGPITNTYSMASVTGGADVGGLVGDDEAHGNVMIGYVTGAVKGNQNTGSIAGLNNGSFYGVYSDIATTGLTTEIGLDNTSSGPYVGGEATSYLQSLLPSDFSNAVWGYGAGLYYYFLWQYPTGTPQSVTGLVSNGATPLSAASVSILIDGKAWGSASTAADGSYYLLVAPGTISNSQVLTYLSGAAGAGLALDTSGPITGLNIGKGLLTTTTDETSYSAFATDLSTAIGSNSTIQAIVSGLGLGIVATSDFAIDQNLDVGAHALSLISGGAITETGSGSITAGILSGSSAGTTTLSAATNDIPFLGAFTLGSFSKGASFALNDAASLTILGTVNTNNASLALTTSGSGHNLAIWSPLITGSNTVDLVSDGTISQNAAGKIMTNALEGDSVGATTLTAAANSIKGLINFSAAGFALSDVTSLTTVGTNNSGNGALSLITTGNGSNLSIDGPLTSSNKVTLTSAGTITQNASGIITAGVLSGSSVGATTLTVAANDVLFLGAFTSAGFSLTDALSLANLGAVNAGTGALSLITTGSGHNLSIDGPLTSSNKVTLTSAGTITQNASGIITAGVLSGSSVGATTLTVAANDVLFLGAFTSAGFSLTDALSLANLGAVNAGTGALSLITTGSGHNLSIDGPLTSSNKVTLTSAGTITQNASGIITAGVLSGSSVGATTLTVAANDVLFLSSFNAAGFVLNDALSLTTLGPVNAGAGALSLTTTSTGDNLSIWSMLTTTGAVSLTSAGTIAEKSGSGAIDASSLTGSATGGVTLTGANLVATLGNFTNSGTGDFDFTDGQALTVSGAVSVAASTGTLDLITTAGNLTVNGTLTGPTVTLNTAGEALEGTAASITATTILNVTAKIGINLNSSHNHIQAVGTRQTTSGPNVINGVGM